MTGPEPGLDALYASFAGLNMEGGWHRRHPALWAQPLPNFRPHAWHYRDVRPILDRAGDLVDTQLAERRNLTMFNPVKGNVYSTVRTLVAAYQMVKPGELARAHRHTANALRLILEGSGTYTVVDGHQVEMRPGDVLLTPNWSWHSHENLGSENCYWMDFLDVPLVHLLEPMFYEPHPQQAEPDPVRVDSASIASVRKRSTPGWLLPRLTRRAAAPARSRSARRRSPPSRWTCCNCRPGPRPAGPAKRATRSTP